MGGLASKSTSGLDVSSTAPAVTPAAESKPQNESTSSGLDVSTTAQNQDPAIAPAAESKPKKKICCACPETKKLRDECIVEHGESACSKWIEAHRACLRAEGFNV